MKTDDLIYYLFCAAAIASVGPIVFRALKFGGFHAGLFGAPVEHTVGEVAATVSSLSSTTAVLRVHVLGSTPARALGLELVAKGVGGYRAVPISLSTAEARNLVALLQTAVGMAGA